MCACVCVCVCMCVRVCLNLHEMLKCAHDPNLQLLSFPIARHVMLVFYLPCIVSLADMFCLNVFDYACRWLQCWDWLMGGHDRHGDVGKSMVWLDCEFHEVMSCCFRFHVIVKNIENA
jgi:hypothetical protein